MGVDFFFLLEKKPLGAVAEVLTVDGMASAKPGFVDRLIHQEF